MKYLLLVIFVFCNPCFAKAMDTDTAHYSFVTKAINSLGGSVTVCDSYALQDNETEWICGSYTQDYKDFMNNWEALTRSFDHQLIPYSDWSVFYNDDNSVDFYGKTYYFNGTEMLVAFDPSEIGREVFIGISPKVFLLIAEADRYVEATPDIQKTPASQPHISGSYDCKNFNSQTEAIQFFTSNGFSSDYDPHNLDADNDGIPCEVLQDNNSYSNQCSTSESWVNSYVKKNGARIKGHCRKRR